MIKKILFLLTILLCDYAVGQTTISAERIEAALAEVTKKYNLLPTDVEGYRISDQYVQKKNGSTHIYINQTIDGLDIFNSQIQLHFSKKGDLVFSNSSFISEKNSKGFNSIALLDLNTTFLAVLDTLNISLQNTLITDFVTVSFGKYSYKNERYFLNPIRIQLGFEKVKSKYFLVYKYNLESHQDGKMYTVFVDANSGEVVKILNKTLTCSFDQPVHSELCLSSEYSEATTQLEPINSKNNAAYRAFPLGVESPIHGNRLLLINQENQIASPFGWHDVDGVFGHEFTITNGNNVFAYEDTSNLNAAGYSPDGGATLNFDFPMTLPLNPIMNLNASLTNLFVWNNFMHDVTHHYGFDEPSGNFQVNNYGNSGNEMDQVFAEGVDGGGSNNANFATPEDGINPTMQMYLFDHSTGDFLTVNSPATIANSYPTGFSGFGLGTNFSPISGNLVLVNSTDVVPTEGCSTILNASSLAGKIAVLDRGTCPFYDKILNVQNSGAIGVIVVNNSPTGTFFMGGTDFGDIFIPAISVSESDGDLLKSYLLQGDVNVTIGGVIQPYFVDSDFDNGVISHEYGHGISNRLTGGPSIVDCLFNEEQAGEGWSDFFALIMTSPSNISPQQARPIGNYAFNLGLNGNGIRPFPYSRDMTVNPLTYADISGVSIPHGVGSVWCSMIWDLYWNLIDEYGNSNDLYATLGGNNKAIQLVMEGMRMQACSPGFVDSRDAIFAADELLFGGENACLIWQTFARRGLGFSADQGSSEFVGDESEAFDLPSFCSGAGLLEPKAIDFSIFPVPSQSVLNVLNNKGLKIDDLFIFDVTGREVDVKLVQKMENQIDISLLNSGTYLLKIQSGGIIIEKRFVVL